MSLSTSKPPRPSRNDFHSRNAEFTASGKSQRRGRRNRFATQASRDSEPERIIALMTQGMKVADIAEAMKMSVATAYRRINALRLPLEATSPEDYAKYKKMAAALLTLLQSNTARAHALFEKRMKKRSKVACCKECSRDALKLESIQLASEVHKAEIAYLKHVGFFDFIRASGLAMDFINKARRQEESESARAAADIAGTNVGVDKHDVHPWSMANVSRKHEKK